MEDSDPKYITTEEFNQAIRSWTTPIKRRMILNVKSKTKGKGKSGAYTNIKSGRTESKLVQSISSSIRKRYGVANRVRFSFPRQGVFIHYGVGRGYKRMGNSIYRVQRRKSGSYEINDSLKRKSVDWFDSEIQKAIEPLADIVQDYYGDEAMKEILNQFDKALIQKRK